MENEEKKSVPSVKGIEANEVPNVKGIGEEKTIDITSVPTTVKEDTSIDPLAMPSVSEKAPKSEAAFDINSVPTTTSSNGSGLIDKSKLPLIVGIAGGVILIIAIIIIILNNTGNKLTCTYNKDGIQATYKIKFDKDDKVTSATLKSTYNVDEISYLKDKSDSDLDEYVNTMKGTLSDNTETGVTYDVKRSGRKIISTQTKTKFDDTELTKKADIKKDLEDDGFTCK